MSENAITTKWDHNADVSECPCRHTSRTVPDSGKDMERPGVDRASPRTCVAKWNMDQTSDTEVSQLWLGQAFIRGCDLPSLGES